MTTTTTIPKSAWRDPSAWSSNHNQVSSAFVEYHLHNERIDGLRVPQSDSRIPCSTNIDIQLARFFHAPPF